MDVRWETEALGELIRLLKNDKSENIWRARRGGMRGVGCGGYISFQLWPFLPRNAAICQRNGREAETKTHNRRDGSIQSWRGFIGDRGTLSLGTAKSVCG